MKAIILAVCVAWVAAQTKAPVRPLDGTFGGNANGAKCVFPFLRNGIEYNDCIDYNDFIDDHSIAWCATTPDYDTDGLWGNCKWDTSKQMTKDGQFCYFPFTYNGQVYTDCTEVDHHTPWCSTTPNYDDHYMWGECILEPTNPAPTSDPSGEA